MPRAEALTRAKFITQKQAGEILGVGVRTIRTMISDGRLTGYRIGNTRTVRLRLDEVENAMQPIPAAHV